MSRLETVEVQVKQLTAKELRAFREWFVQFDAAAWDQQIESDAKSGKLDALAGRALRDHQAGKQRNCEASRDAGLLACYRALPSHAQSAADRAFALLNSLHFKRSIDSGPRALACTIER